MWWVCGPGGKPGAKKVLLDAHLDEIGFIITGQEEGYLRFAPLGGVDPRMLPNRELTVLTNPPRLVCGLSAPTHPEPGGHGQIPTYLGTVSGPGPYGRGGQGHSHRAPRPFTGRGVLPWVRTF